MSLSRKETIAALEPVKAAVAARSAIQELSHIWFDGHHVYATNGGIGVKAKFESPFNFGVPGTLLLGLLNQASKDTLDFEQEGNGLKLKAGRSKLTLNTLPFSTMPWRYPAKPAKKAVASFKITEDVIKALKRVAFFKPEAKNRMEYHSICIFAVDDEMDFYLTDSKSLVVMPVSEKLEGSGKKIALPRELAEQIVARCKPGCELNMYSDHFSVKASDNIHLYSNVLDTSQMLDFPRVASQFTDPKKFPAVDIPKDLLAALERAVVLAGTEDPDITFKTNGKKLKLSGRFRYGELDEEFDFSKAVTGATLKLNAKLLAGIKDVKKMSFSPKAVSFYGADDFVYVLGAKGEAAPPPREAEAETETESEGEDA